MTPSADPEMAWEVVQIIVGDEMIKDGLDPYQYRYLWMKRTQEVWDLMMREEREERQAN